MNLNIIKYRKYQSAIQTSRKVVSDKLQENTFLLWS